MEEKQEPRSKPIRDGRMNYFSILEKNLMVLTEAQAYGDFNAWFRILKTIYGYVRPHCNKEELEKINVALEIVDVELYKRNDRNLRNHPLYLGSLDRKLQRITEDLLMAAKDLLLPASVNDDDLDDDAFSRHVLRG